MAQSIQKNLDTIFGWFQKLFSDEDGGVVFKGDKDVLQWGTPQWINNL